MNNRSGNARAAAVSRALAKAGLRPLPSETPRDRQGLRVSRGIGPVSAYVHASYNLHREAAEAAGLAAEALRGVGYEVEQVGRNGYLLIVRRVGG